MRASRESASRPLAPTVWVLAAVSFLTDVSADMIYPLLPAFLSGTLGASAAFIGVIEGAAESTAALLKLASGWWSDRVRRRKPLVVAGYGVAAVARPLVALATQGWHVLAIRLADRVGKGVRSAPRDALIADATDPRDRGRAYGMHRAADNAGAVAGPLLAFALLAAAVPERTVFALAAVPGVLGVLLLAWRVTERGASGHADESRVASPRASAASPTAAPLAPFAPGFPLTLTSVLVFTLGNSTDAFLLLRARDVGVPLAQLPLLWALFNGVKALASMPGGALSDRVGRRPVVLFGWALFAAVYAAFAVVRAPWQAWALFALYGLTFGVTEGTEKALVADLTPPARRGAAFGWYNAAVGLGALPASVLFGILWTTAGPAAAFGTGAALALVASLLLALAPMPHPPARGAH